MGDRACWLFDSEEVAKVGVWCMYSICCCLATLALKLALLLWMTLFARSMATSARSAAHSLMRDSFSVCTRDSVVLRCCRVCAPISACERSAFISACTASDVGCAAVGIDGAD